MKPYYQHGGITIFHGDSRSLPAVLAQPFAACVTDPPYGIAHSSSHGASWMNTQIAGDSDTTSRDNVLQAIGDTRALVFGTWKTPPPKGTHTALVWDKGPAFGMGDLSVPWKPSWELVYVIGAGFVGRRSEGVLRNLSGVSWESKGRKHPHEKPIKLLMALIGKCPEGAILDPFAGSGTCLAAAKQLGRQAVGIEIEERYCEIAAKRLSQEMLPGMAFADG